MNNITKFYKKEQNLKAREEKNKPMQLALTTKRIMSRDEIEEEEDE
jgi:hypothetical protein